jgi:hypothetical protein
MICTAIRLEWIGHVLLFFHRQHVTDVGIGNNGTFSKQHLHGRRPDHGGHLSELCRISIRIGQILDVLLVE